MRNWKEREKKMILWRWRRCRFDRHQCFKSMRHILLCECTRWSTKSPSETWKTNPKWAHAQIELVVNIFRFPKITAHCLCVGFMMGIGRVDSLSDLTVFHRCARCSSYGWYGPGVWYRVPIVWSVSIKMKFSFRTGEKFENVRVNSSKSIHLLLWPATPRNNNEKFERSWTQ